MLTTAGADFSTSTEILPGKAPETFIPITNTKMKIRFLQKLVYIFLKS